jgi:hypothetical protein
MSLSTLFWKLQVYQYLRKHPFFSFFRIKITKTFLMVTLTNCFYSTYNRTVVIIFIKCQLILALQQCGIFYQVITPIFTWRKEETRRRVLGSRLLPSLPQANNFSALCQKTLFIFSVLLTYKVTKLLWPWVLIYLFTPTLRSI